jgi:sterol desaturase/sphingolipid hydroxylase (fatty acid hydroxylase superfamily)
MRKPSNWVTGAIVLGALGLLTWLERRRPLRKAVEPKLTRLARNLAIAAGTGLVLKAADTRLGSALAERVERRRLGLLKMVPLPRWLETALAVVLLDYTMYLFHVLNHRVPFLWRLHVVHHADRDLDASTGIRFHFAEFAVSMVWRTGQIVAIGVSPSALAIWQTAFVLEVLFHHSNVRLPLDVERALTRFVVAPRMHGIHHSTVEEETNSNFSSGLTVWDRLHGTLRLDVPQEEITIGVPELQKREDVTLGKMLALPFGWQ